MNGDQRDERGRFVKGTAPGPGRPAKARELAYLAVFQEIVTLDKWREVIKQAVEDAIGGGALDSQSRERARRFLADYVIGRPKQVIQFDRDPSPFGEYDELGDDELRAIASAEEHRAGDPGGEGPAAR